MDFLELMEKLSPQQRENAILVATAASKAGVDPTLAVAIAYQESRLNSNVGRGKSGEIGMMQVMPDTGKAMGFDEKALADPQKNIEAGIKYLQRALTATDNDPMLAAAFYNGGPGAIEALRGGKDPDQRVIDYVKSLQSYGTFSQAQPTGPSESESQDELVDVPPPSEEVDSGADPGSRLLLGGAGAAIGTGAVGVDAMMTQRDNALVRRAGLEELARLRAQKAEGVAQAAPGARSAAARPSGAGPRMPPPIPGLTLTGNIDKPYAGFGSGNANYGWKFQLPDIELGKVASMGGDEEGAQRFIKQRAEGMSKARAAAPGSILIERPSGILETISTGGRPKFSGIQLGPMPTDPGDPRNLYPFFSQPNQVQERPTQIPQKAPTPIAVSKPSGLDYISDKFMSMMRPVAKAAATGARYVLPPVAGLSAGLDVAEAAHEYNKPQDQRDYATIGLRGASALGGALSMIPASMPVGIPISLGASAIQAYRDDPEIFKKMRKKIFSSENPEQMVAP